MAYRKQAPGPREPRSVGELIDAISAGRGWGDRLALGRLQQRWTLVAGEAVASHSAPVKLEGGVLTIKADQGPWATELSLLATKLATKADQALGGGVVRAVRVVSRGASERPSQP